METIFQAIGKDPGAEATVHLSDQTLTVHVSQDMTFRFDIDPSVKERFLQGLDDIGITMKEEKLIVDFEKRHPAQFFRI